MVAMASVQVLVTWEGMVLPRQDWGAHRVR